MARGAVADVRAGAVTLWASTSALTALVPAASVYAGDLPASPAPPYVQLAAEPVGTPIYPAPSGSGKPYVCQVRLTVRVWAAGAAGAAATAALEPVVAAVLAAFDNESWDVPDSALLASQAGEPAEAEEKDEYNGEPVWRADVPFDLTLQRVVK